jgi:glycosyltransferase involved in cell wall biosynthesis
VSHERPRVVACMPAYQSTAFIGPVLESLAAQTYSNLEILISVDVCSDGTADLCDQFATTHSNVTVIRQPERRGWVGNSNALLHAARGDYFFFAFHDDPLKPQYVERLVDVLERSPGAVVGFSDMDSAGGVRVYNDLDGVTDRFERIRRLMFVYGKWWIPFRGLVRSDVVRRLGGMKPLLAGEQHTDWLWLLRLAGQGEFVRVPEPLLFKVQRASGVEAGWKRNVRNELAAQLALVGVIRGAHLSPMQEARLYSALLRRWLRSVLRLMKKRSAPPHEMVRS